MTFFQGFLLPKHAQIRINIAVPGMCFRGRLLYLLYLISSLRLAGISATFFGRVTVRTPSL